ncbi:MAG: tRNA uridine(34) 5-carboxymethylaminomethyl modification radical SAM/GNAT enzyme Elp3 [Chloroflexi bacterium]|nr:tRNA uridine(34) 5-carboxymethylaminomethyl modification radical SAM/GNAT enzyme Elp3 [Chloroflexota bacterium]MCC6895023.1 tRNA uridine(34) 5-carboxymethylaminomethyl modification radical SAM/GNAT enzyme Elp3 [Anaerolineae bacterium]
MSHRQTIDLQQHREPLLKILTAVVTQPDISRKQLDQLLRDYPKGHDGTYSRDDLILAYRTFAGESLPPYEQAVLERLRRKPVRTSSGVTPVTVLTKPFPCPGECIFCPNDVRMPKSYLSDEPGAQRAEQNSFDPYLQTYTRLQSYHNTGHPTDKIEIIVLGGTWSFYPESYQIWFIKRIFDAMHDFGKGIDSRQAVEDALLEKSQLHPDRNTTTATIDGRHIEKRYNAVVQLVYKDEMLRSTDLAQAISRGEVARSPVDEFATWEELEAAHLENETAPCRSVGLVIETRPDHISVEEVLRVRRLGCTKVQIGFQSLNDEVLKLNKRGHKVAATRRAVKLLRQAGFKIHAHWMPNLYGSSPEADIADYKLMFDDPDFRPDELKVYPCSLIESAELMQRYQDGSWKPYTHDELLHVLTESFRLTPEYCRLTRVIRDIPSTDIVVGNQMTNFRQIVENELSKAGERSRDIRAREVRFKAVDAVDLHLDEMWYDGGCSDEVFLQFITASRDIAGFLRLSLPNEPAITDELTGAAMIREIHVYGQSLELGASEAGRAQHLGLGKQLIERAVEIAREKGFLRLAVISAIGTREYYRKRGFTDGQLYQVRSL